MARTRISEFSATAADNTDIDSIDIAEGCAPSGINNAIRELMAQLKDFQTGAGGDSFTTANLAYTGTLTGGTGVINIGSGQVYKDASGNVGIGTSSPGFKFVVNAGDISLSGTQQQAQSILANGTADNADLDIKSGSSAGTFSLIKVTSNWNGSSATGGRVAFYTAGTERMRLDAAGNLGLGVTPSAWYTGFSGFDIGTKGALSGANGGAILWANCYLNSSAQVIRKSTGYTARYVAAADVGQHIWLVGPYAASGGGVVSETQAMTLTDDGRLLLGTTTARTGVNSLTLESFNSYFLMRAAGTTALTQIAFVRDTAGTPVDVGSISTTGTTTSYITTSDYRLKENVQPMQNALATVASLKPCTYTWKTDGSAGQGFIAHELQAVVPDAVTGEKDAMRTVDVFDEDGKVIGTKQEPKYQGVDTSFLVATLTAAIQELKAEFDAYKAAHP